MVEGDSYSSQQVNLIWFTVSQRVHLVWSTVTVTPRSIGLQNFFEALM